MKQFPTAEATCFTRKALRLCCFAAAAAVGDNYSILARRHYVSLANCLGKRLKEKDKKDGEIKA
jgi:hypothetical protein